MTALRLQPAGLAHTAVLVGLYAQCFDDPWSTQSMAAAVASPGAFAVIAAQENKDGPAPVGFALARHAADEVEVLSLGVLPSHRRRSIGTMLLREVMRRARQAGARRIVLEVSEANEAARTLYAAHGFQALGRRPDYYQRANSVPVAALTMACDLPAISSGGH